MRRARLLPGFRRERVVVALEEAIERATHARFRVLHYSVQDDHLHFVVEATDRVALSRGVQGLAIRLAFAFNRAVRRRGKVWGDRYHARDLRSPREVRAGIVYVLMNHKKHFGRRGPRSGRTGGSSSRVPSRAPLRVPLRVPSLDPFSSAAWFDGFSSRAGPLVVRLRATLPTQILPVARPRTWLAKEGWRRRGLIDPSEQPA